MTQPIAFETLSARHALPLLVAAQAQKEFFVNEAFARIDALLHPVVQGELGEPPGSPLAGDSWVVASPASGSWQGHEDRLATWDGSQWTFCSPSEGMHVFDRSNGQRLAYSAGWRRPARPPVPAGGAVVDAEARAAIGAIVDMLATLAIIPPD